MNFQMSDCADRLKAGFCALVLSTATLAGLALMTQPAAALSEIQREELPPPLAPITAQDEFSPGTVPLPDPIETSQPSSSGSSQSPEDEQPTEQLNPNDTPETPQTETMGELPEVIYDLARLPEPVRRMHDLILKASKSGDINQLRPLVGTGNSATQLSLTEIDDDPVDFLKSLSGDTEGQEILAIMEEVLSAGFIHLDAGTPQELYVWPYFFGLPLDKLSAPQRVELFKIVTAGDLEDMQQFGAYIFYRLGITPEGRWAFFVAGD